MEISWCAALSHVQAGQELVIDPFVALRHRFRRPSPGCSPEANYL